MMLLFLYKCLSLRAKSNGALYRVTTLFGEPDAFKLSEWWNALDFEARDTRLGIHTLYFLFRGELHEHFVSDSVFGYHGEALDHKTPLLRSNNALNEKSLRIFKTDWRRRCEKRDVNN